MVQRVHRCREKFIASIGKLIVRLHFVRLVALSDLTFWIDDEYSTQGHLDIQVAHCISLSVTKATVKWTLIIWEQLEHVLEARYLKNLRLSLNHLSVERLEQAIWTHEQWTAWQSSLQRCILTQTVDVVSSRL